MSYLGPDLVKRKASKFSLEMALCIRLKVLRIRQNFTILPENSEFCLVC